MTVSLLAHYGTNRWGEISESIGNVGVLAVTNFIHN